VQDGKASQSDSECHLLPGAGVAGLSDQQRMQAESNLPVEDWSKEVDKFLDVLECDERADCFCDEIVSTAMKDLAPAAKSSNVRHSLSFHLHVSVTVYNHLFPAVDIQSVEVEDHKRGAMYVSSVTEFALVQLWCKITQQ
jgi:hypothetical protein